MEQYEKLMAFENGDLDESDTIDLFQELIDSGLAWKLQEMYGRIAKQLIESGHCSVKRCTGDNNCGGECE